jgi:hypothetical protein
MPPDQRSSPTTGDVAFATVLALARMRLVVRSGREDTDEARAVCAAILEARGRSAGRDAGIVEASQRLISASRELLRRSGQEGGPAHGPLDDGQGSA